VSEDNPPDDMIRRSFQARLDLFPGVQEHSEVPILVCESIKGDSFGSTFRKSIAQDKDTARIVLDNKLRTLRLKLNGYIFCFKQQDNPGAFAEPNGLTLAQAKAVLPGLRTVAAQWLDMTKLRFDRAAPHGRLDRDPATGKERVGWYITFRTFLPTAEPQPWHTFFKRLHLDPVDHEPSAP